MINTFLIMFITAGAAFASTDSAVLLKRYFDFSLNDEVTSACQKIMSNAPASDKAEILEAVKAWTTGNKGNIRDSLVNAFGDDARSKYSEFIANYSSAESKGDVVFLKELAPKTGLKSEVSGYDQLRAAAARELMTSSLANASSFMGDVETWLELGVMDVERPPLDAWLLRDRGVRVKTKAVKKKRSLRNMEASSGTFRTTGSGDANPLDALSKMRDEKRAKALKDATAGMAMVA